MNVIALVLLAVLGPTTLLILVGVYIFLMHPEKIMIWSGIIWRLLSMLGALFKGAHKQYVRLDLQGRLNEFAKKMENEAPFLAGTRVHVEWIDPDSTRKSFLEDDRIVLRLRRDDRDETNFVHGAYMFVSTSLVAKAKRYLSPSQRKSLDLFSTTKVLQMEKRSVVSRFVDDYLHPETADPNSKVSAYVDSFAKIDAGGLFNSVVLQELDFLGDKVFGKRRDERIIKEVDSLLEFLEPIAARTIGEENDLNFHKEYCRFGLVIIGKPSKVSAGGYQPYVGYIMSHLRPLATETIYLLGRWENQALLDRVCDEVSDSYETIQTRKSKVKLKYGVGPPVEKEQYLKVLRLPGAELIQPSS
ncbi:MAG: hypothetical protein IH958_02350 [Chloroflexi bacterium]|nr:hypothetical protein [Chloroflexota bacterium]